MKTPINTGLAQSDLDLANFKVIRGDLSDYAGIGVTWNNVTKRFDSSGAGINVIYLSASVASDAAGAIGYGSTAPSGVDVTADVQTTVDSVPAGGTLIWDVAVGLSAPILIPSNITITAPGREFGAILRANANCPMFRNVGITTDVTTSKQKTFGKLDPDHPGDQKYRVLDPVNYMNDRNITFMGGTWNPNVSAQSATSFTAAYGFLSAFQFWGVDNLVLRDLYILKSRGSVTMQMINVHGVRIDNLEIDGTPLSFVTPDAASGNLMINGPSRNIRITNPTIHASDDPLAFNANEADAAAMNTWYGGGGSVCTPGVNWAQNGDITDVVVKNLVLSTGIEGVNCCGIIRFFTSVHLIDDVLIDGIFGTVQKFAFNIGAHNSESFQISGTGNLGKNVEIRNCTSELVTPINAGDAGRAVFDIVGGGGCLRITGRKRGTIPADGVPDVIVTDPTTGGSGTLKELFLEGDYLDTGTVAAPQIKIIAAVTRVYARTRSHRVNTANASPVLLTDTGANIELFDFHGDLSGATNIVKHVAGTLGTVVMRGAHRKANGGSPLDVANALTVLNGWHPDLAFVSGNGFKSGAGTLTHDNDYTDP